MLLYEAQNSIEKDFVIATSRYANPSFHEQL